MKPGEHRLAAPVVAVGGVRPEEGKPEVSHDKEQMSGSIVVVGRGFFHALQQRSLSGQITGLLVSVQDEAEALALMRQCCVGAVLIPDGAAASHTLRLIHDAKSLSPETPVVVVSAEPCVDHAVRFVRAGASDYVPLSFDGGSLCRLIEGLRLERERRGGQRGRFFCDQCPPGVEIVGQSPGIVRCLETIRLVSQSRCNPLLILGETGSGKELAARAVHWWRYGGFERFVAVNCATLTAGLLESELFGHVKGAFTGADREKAGLFEQATDGSILLDEISEMPPALQAKLLRVLQERTFRKVGGTGDITCNATVIATSNKDLTEEVRKGRFRRDLYYRLTVFPIVVPPLRHEDHRGDIILLAEYFLRCSGNAAGGGAVRLSRQAEQRLIEHDWPGNVRELRNVIERAMIVEKSGDISACNLVFDLRQGQAHAPGASQATPGKDFSLEAAEREFIVRALKETGWQRTRAAALLGITRATLHAKLKRYDIKTPTGRQPPVQDSTELRVDDVARPG